MTMASPTLPAPSLASKRSTSSLSTAQQRPPRRPKSKASAQAVPVGTLGHVLRTVALAAAAAWCLAVLVSVASRRQLPSAQPLARMHRRVMSVGSHLYSAQLAGFFQPTSNSLSPAVVAPHPILPLLLGARVAWSRLVGGQSRTLDKARRAYSDRYDVEPPPGFDQWFHFARVRNFTLVDAFDGLMEDLSRFRGLGGTELRRRTRELADISGVSLVTVKGGQVDIRTKSGRWAPAMAVKEMIESLHTGYAYELDAAPEGSNLRRLLEKWEVPEFEMAVNERSEGRVLPKWETAVVGKEFQYLPETIARAALDDPEARPSLGGFAPEWTGAGNEWEAYRQACPAESAARRLVETLRGAEAKTGAVAAGGGVTTGSRNSTSRRRPIQPHGTAPLPSAKDMAFIPDLESSASFCDQPSTHHLHSAFFTDARAIGHLYPLFSGAKPQGFADVLVPTHHHWNPTTEYTYEWDLKHGRTDLPSDVPWEDKLAKAYWRGKVTRGADTPPGHMSGFQKQRLVKMVSDEQADDVSSLGNKGEADPSRLGNTQRVIVALNVSSARLESVAAPAGIVDPLLFDIAMACDPSMGECAYLTSLGYHVEPPASLGEAWKHKIVLDLDEAGFSPRFGALMESESAVVKMSVQQEFWRDWVVPWFHFIPLSSSYSELHNIATFFLGIPPELAKDKLPIVERRRMSSSTAEDLEGFEADRELRKIGELGREWKLRHMRKADMEIYMLRVIIEWARLLNEPDPTPAERVRS